MRNIFISLSVFCATFTFAQNTNCENVKTENDNLKSVIKSLNEEIGYLKNVLNINQPIKEVEKDGILLKITKVQGNLAEKRVMITLLAETKDKERDIYFHTNSLIDIEGNDVKIDFYKSDIQKKLTTDTPVKMIFSFVYQEDFENEAPRIAKLFKIRGENKIIGTFSTEKTDIEFKDLNIIWK